MTSPLELLASCHAFTPYPGWAELGHLHVEFDLLARLHVPYDQLQADQVEARLRRALGAGTVVGLTGPNGAGKSSVASYVCGPFARELAPFRVPIRAEDDRIATPRGFVVQAIKVVAQAAREAELLTRSDRDAALEALAGRRDLAGRWTSGLRARIAPSWLLGAGVEVSADLARAAPQPGDLELSTTELVEQLQRMLSVVERHQLLPVLVVDESDKWTDTARTARSGMAEEFFTEIPRLFADLPAAGILGVHSTYRGATWWSAVADTTPIVLPELDHPSQIAKILGRRVELVGQGVTLDQVFNAGALDEIFAAYRQAASIRAAVALARDSVAAAIDAHQATVTPSAVAAAVAVYPGGSDRFGRAR